MIKLPLFINGLALGTLFTPLVLYMLGSVHPSLSGNASLTGTATRFWGSTLGYSIMQNVLLYMTTKYQFYLSSNLPESSAAFQDQFQGTLNKQLSSHVYLEAHQLAVGEVQIVFSNQALLLSELIFFMYCRCSVLSSRAYVWSIFRSSQE